MSAPNAAARQDPRPTRNPGTTPESQDPAPEELTALILAFAQFRTECAEHDWVEARILIPALTHLIRAVRGMQRTIIAPATQDIALPVLREVRDAIWAAGRSGRYHSLRGAVLAAQLRLRFIVAP